MKESPSANPRRSLVIDLDWAERRVSELNESIRSQVQERDGLQAVIDLARQPHFAGAHFDLAAEGAAINCAPRPELRDLKMFTHRDMVLDVLGKSAEPLGVRQILDGIEATFGRRLERTSISPLLRKLAGKGEVLHDDQNAKWTASRPLPCENIDDEERQAS